MTKLYTLRTLREAYEEALSVHDYLTAIPLLKLAVSLNDPQAIGAWASLLTLGRGVERDFLEGTFWFRRGAELGDLHAQGSLGICLVHGIGTPVDLQEAAHWLYRAAQRGHMRSIEQLDVLVANHPQVVGKHFTEPELKALPRSGVRP